MSISPTRAGSDVGLLESFEHSGWSGESGDIVLPAGDRGGVGTEVEKSREEKDMSVDFHLWLCPLIPTDDLSLEAEGSPETLQLPQSVESLDSSDSASNSNNANMLKDRWVCDFPLCGQLFQKKHDRKSLPLFPIIRALLTSF